MPTTTIIQALPNVCCVDFETMLLHTVPVAYIYLSENRHFPRCRVAPHDQSGHTLLSECEYRG